MIVVAILGLLTAIALPSFLAARTQPQKSLCINNLRQIDAAKQMFAFDNRVGLTGEAPTPEQILPYLGQGLNGTLPICPLDNSKSFATSYQINDMQTVPACLISPTNHFLL